MRWQGRGRRVRKTILVVFDTETRHIRRYDSTTDFCEATHEGVLLDEHVGFEAQVIKAFRWTPPEECRV